MGDISVGQSCGEALNGASSLVHISEDRATHSLGGEGKKVKVQFNFRN